MDDFDYGAAAARAIKKAGGFSKVAFSDFWSEPLTPSAVQQWTYARVPSERVLGLERLSGISRHEIRPDVYGPPPDPLVPKSSVAFEAVA